MRRFVQMVTLTTLCVLGAAACGATPDTSPPAPAAASDVQSSKEVLSVCSWWTAPGEAEALGALIDGYRSSAGGARVTLATDVTAGTWSKVYDEKLGAGLWDVFQLSAADLATVHKAHPTWLATTDEAYGDAAFASAIIPEARTAVTVDGHAYGVATGIHRNNAFLFNKQLLAAHRVTAPTTIAELLVACETLKTAGVTPVATTFRPWTLRIMFDDILEGTLGARAFGDFVAGRTALTDPALQSGIRSAIDTFGKILTDYIDVPTSAAETYDWTDAAETLHAGKAAMFFHGDWAKGYLIQLGWTPDVEFGVSGPPGASSVFIYGVDMFGAPASAPHPALSQAFLAFVGSKAGQVAFNSHKGSTPIRTDVRDLLDPVTKASLDDLVHAELRIPSHANETWTTAIGAFAKDGDKEALFQVYRTTPP